MSKGLEALEKGFWKLTHKGNIKFYNVVENELKELEDLQKVLDDFGIHNTMNLIDTLKIIQFLEKRNAVNSKKLKALEIIKNKRVDIYHIQATNRVGEYNFWKLSTSKRLKKEEYELLKEELK